MFSIKGAKNTEQSKILNDWLNDNFADGSVRAVFTEENHAKIINQRGRAMPVEIQDGRVIDYNAYYSQKMKELEDMIAEVMEQHKKAVENVSQTYRRSDFQSLNSKFDSALQKGDELIKLQKEQTNLRIEKLHKTQWDIFLVNDDWVPMEQPRQLSSEYFDNQDIQEVILYYQLDEEARQEIVTDLSYMEKMQYGMPDRFYLGKVNGKSELIAGEDFMDHELFHFSGEATRSYELGCSALKKIAESIYDYDDVVSLTVDEQHLNHEAREPEGKECLYEAAVEEVLEAAMTPEPEMGMEM